MVTLTAPHWEMVTPAMQRLVIAIGQPAFMERFYLAGGTALALQIGHRRSVDLDFFSESDEVDAKSRNEIIRELSTLSTQVLENVDGNLLLLVNGIRTGFFSYGYPLVQEPVRCENVNLASIIDIGLMKCDALISRGSRKDFYDLYYIAQRLSFEELLRLSEQKYAQFRDFPLMVLESMNLFENADRDVQPDLSVDLPWEQVKQFFTQQAGLLSRLWFD